MKKLISILVAFAMMATLCVCMAFAAPAAQSTDLSKSVITKVLDVPDGVASPAGKMNFTVTPTSQPATAGLTAKTESITFAAGTGTQTKVLSLADFIGLNNTAKDFNITQPGEYVFTVAEDSFNAAGVATAPAEGAYYLQDTDSLSTENLAKDTKTYTLRIYVVNGNNGLEIKAITVVDASVTDDTTTEASEIDNAKINPEDTDPTVTDPDDKVGSAFKFTNVYTKTITDETDPNGAFNVAKNVTGSGDTNYLYPIKVTITIDDATLVDGAYTLNGSKSGEWNFTTATKTLEKTITIKNGEKDVFATFPAGAKVKIEEQTSTMNNLQNADKYNGNAAGLVTGTYTDGAKMTTNEAVYTAKSAVTVTNNLESSAIEPEGIMIQNLPYIVLALIAVGGLVAYVVVRRRQNDEA